jgi:hypothetical protein
VIARMTKAVFFFVRDVSKPFMTILAALAVLAESHNPSRAETVNIPNDSFESPATPFVNVNIDSWQKSAKPDWYVEGGGYFWTQLTGTFKNSPTNSSDHIDNCHGDQAIWLFAVPEVAIFQDYSSVDWDDLAPTHAFDAKFEAGKSYQLTVGLIGGGYGMLPGVTLELSLYYRDAASNQVVVAATTATHSITIFSNRTHLIDFTVDVPTVQAADACAGRNIGMQFLSTVSTNLEGGYWDLDNIRLVSTRTPTLVNPVRTNGQFEFTLLSEPGLTFEILATSDFTLPSSGWTSLGTLTNVTGAIPFIDTSVNFDQRFYQARKLP